MKGDSKEISLDILKKSDKLPAIIISVSGSLSQKGS